MSRTPTHPLLRLQLVLALAACSTVVLAGCDGSARGEDRTPRGPGSGVPPAADLAGRDGGSGEGSSP